MPKIRLTRLDRYGFSTELTIRVSDLNYGGHLGYDSILTLAHQARLEMFGHWEVSELNLGDGETGLVAGDVAANYLGEGFLNEILQIQIQPVEIGGIGFRLAHRFSKAGTDLDVALLEIGFVGFNYRNRRPGPLPATFVGNLMSISG